VKVGSSEWSLTISLTMKHC